MRDRKFRPHWIVLDEAQEFLFEGSEVTALLRPLLETGGWAFVSYRPDRLSESVLTSLHHLLLTRLTDRQIGDCLKTHCAVCSLKDTSLDQIPMGSALLCGGEIVRMRPAIRRVPHIRHLYKYLDVPLPPGKRFSFRTEKGHLGIEAASLYELSPPDSDPPAGESRIPRSSRGFCEMGRSDARRRRARRASQKSGESPLSGR